MPIINGVFEAPEGHTYRLCRADRYSRELLVLANSTDRRAAQFVYEMEDDLLRCEGNPMGSYCAPGPLSEASTSDWYRLLEPLETNEPGAAKKALTWIDEQRVYEKHGLAIVYVVVRNTEMTTIYLGALTHLLRKDRDILWKFLNLDP